MQNTETQAIFYTEKLHWNIIPIGQDKKPLIAWKKYQTVQVSIDEIDYWLKRYPGCGIAVVTGSISDIIVVDIDPRHNGTNEQFRDIETVSVKSGGGGFHYYFKYEKGIENKANIQPGIDIRGDGGYIILPPSLHPSGSNYEWINAPYENTKPTALPDFVKSWIKIDDHKNKPPSNGISTFQGVTEGSRNQTATSVIGSLLNRYPESEWEDRCWPLIKAFNDTNSPPLPEDELRNTFESIKNRESSKSDDDNTRKSLAQQIVCSIMDDQYILFHDQYKDGYISLTGNGSHILKIQSKTFKKWLANYCWNKFERASNSAITDAIQTIEGSAIHNGKMFTLYTRIAKQENAIWYDNCDGTCVRITNEGWTMVSNPPILFRRLAHQKPQVHPERGGSVSDLCNLVNINSDEDKLLFQIITVAAFIPDFPHPIIVLYGPQGSGKTTPLRILKNLIDPSLIETLSVSDNQREFVQTASHHWFIPLDNLTRIQEWLSDSLCRAVTGDGFSKRELFSDDDDVIYYFQRPIALNGINLVVEKPDLLERSLVVELERITDEKRRTEEDIFIEFESIKPWLLGAIFDSIVIALNEYPKIHLTSHPRMADFAKMGCAISKALGHTETIFINAYTKNVGKQNNVALDNSNVAAVIFELMKNIDEWEGTATELLRDLTTLAEKNNIPVKDNGWPKDQARLVKKILIMQTNLQQAGINVIKHNTRPRKISLIKTDKFTVATDEPSDLKVNTTDGILQQSDNTAETPIIQNEASEQYIDSTDGADST